MTKSLEAVQEFWRSAAQQPLDQDGLRPTARDPFLQELVEAAIEQRIRGGRLLDVGCGDGLSTLRFAPKVNEAVGVDFVQAFVDRAVEHSAEQGVPAIFEQADVMDLEPVRARHGEFDIVTSIRCLINLATPQNQKLGLSEISKCVRSGGLFLTSEGWQDGIDGINRRRVAAKLPAMTATEYNLLMPRAEFEAEARKHFDIVDYVPFGFYLFMSRVFMPALVAPEPPRHSHAVNRAASALQLQGVASDEFQDCDYAGVYVLRRR